MIGCREDRDASPSEPGAGQRLRARVPDASWQIIQDTLPLDWIELEHDRHIVTGFMDVLGHDRAHLFFRGLLAQQLESSLLRSTVTTALRMFGATPGALARAFPIGFSTTYRDVGRVRAVPRGAGEAAIVFEAVAPEVLDTPAYPESFRGFFAGFFDVCRVEGEVESVNDFEGGRIEFSLRWAA